MRIDAGIVFTLLATEIRLLVRDRRTVVVSIVLPLLVMPLLLFAGQVMQERRNRRLETTRFTYVVTGSRVEEARRLLEAAQRQQLTSYRLLLQEVTAADPVAALAEASLDLWVQALAADESPSLPAASSGAGGSHGDEAATPGVSVILLVYRADRERSGEAAQRLRDALTAVRQAERFKLLADAGLPVPAEQVVAVEERDVATAEQVTGLRVGRLLTVFFLLFVFSGGAVVATDTLAGEKERGTLETLLTTAAGRREVIAAKLLAIFAVAVAITVIQTLNFLVYIVLRLVPLPDAFALDISAATALAVLVMLLPVAALVSGILLLTSGMATSYKEAQLYFFPTFLLTLAPALASFLPGLTLRSVIALVPIAGVAVGVKEILTGAADVPMLLLTWLVNAGAAATAALAAERSLSNERLLAATAEPAATKPSPQLFQRHVLRAFAVLWAILLVASLNLEGKLDLRAQAMVNLVGVLLVGTLVLVRRYRLDPRQALALRPVRWPVWIAVAIGAPSGLLTGIGVFRLANLVVPVPPEMIETFSEALLPEEFPLWQAILFAAVLPGICEELAFRGLLTYGLHRRLDPRALIPVVAIVFGVFHAALFRIAPTAYLGMLLTTLTLLTGSVFPAMVWHALHNALALWAAHLGAPLEEASATVYGCSAVALLLAGFIVWRARTPYPRLRRKGR